MLTILELLGKTTTYFESRGVPNAKLDAQILLAEVLGCKRLELFLRFEDPVVSPQLDRYREFVRRRAKREPLQHILGKTEFFGIVVKSDARALVPRPETEYLCELLTERFFADASAKLSILELGVGSGAVSLALKKYFKNASVKGVDISPDALSLACENAQSLGLDAEFLLSDWFENLRGEKFDLIVANPPYLSREELECAQPEVREFDPISALVSPEDGIADLRKILSNAPEFLNDGGLVACECGVAHPDMLAAEFAGAYSELATAADMSNRPRYVFCRK